MLRSSVSSDLQLAFEGLHWSTSAVGEKHPSAGALTFMGLLYAARFMLSNHAFFSPHQEPQGQIV